MQVEKKYAPTSIDGVIYKDAATKMRVERYAEGKLSGHIIFYGPNGTGKSTAAHLLPQAISGPNAMIESKSLDELLGMKDLKTYLLQAANTAKLFFASKYFLVYDEADTAKGNMAKFWTAIDQCGSDVMMIFTTNHPMEIPGSIRSRADEIEFPSITPQQFLPTARNILATEGVHISATQLLYYLTQIEHTPDLRKYCRKLDELIFVSRSNLPLPPVPALAANQLSLKVVANKSQ